MEEFKHVVRETFVAVHGIDENGNKTINQYSLISKLGQGSFGKVKLCKFEKDFFAMKIYSKAFLRRKKDYSQGSTKSLSQNSALSSVYREISLMKTFTHQNIIKLHEVIDDQESEKLYLILDYCDKGAIME